MYFTVSVFCSEAGRDPRAGLPGHQQAALALMSPSMVHKSSQGELGLLLLEKLMEGQDQPCKLNQHARMAILAALTQIETTDSDACSRIVLCLSKVCLIQVFERPMQTQFSPTPLSLNHNSLTGLPYSHHVVGYYSDSRLLGVWLLQLLFTPFPHALLTHDIRFMPSNSEQQHPLQPWHF